MAKVLMKGNEAIAEAAVRAGCRFFAGYPITPQNEIPEYLSWRLPEVGGTFVQGESEVASVNMVYGAAASGCRARLVCDIDGFLKCSGGKHHQFKSAVSESLCCLQIVLLCGLN